MTVSLQRTALRVGEAPPRPPDPKKRTKFAAIQNADTLVPHYLLAFAITSVCPRPPRPASDRARASDCDGFIRGENDDDDGGDSLPHDDPSLVFQVIGRLELGGPSCSGTALHHWNEVISSPRRQIAEWHKLTE